MGGGFVPAPAGVEMEEFARLGAAAIAGAIDEEAPVSLRKQAVDLVECVRGGGEREA